jgi:hypothetical protein
MVWCPRCELYLSAKLVTHVWMHDHLLMHRDQCPMLQQYHTFSVTNVDLSHTNNRAQCLHTRAVAKRLECIHLIIELEVQR